MKILNDITREIAVRFLVATAALSLLICLVLQVPNAFTTEVSIPEQSGHRFHAKADSDSIPIRTPIPFESGQ